jgi:hypothetical protein
MKLSARAERLLADIEAAERVCRLYTPKNPARDPDFRAAAGCFGEYAENYSRFLDDNLHLLTAAENHEQQAEAEEPMCA